MMTLITTYFILIALFISLIILQTVSSVPKVPQSSEVKRILAEPKASEKYMKILRSGKKGTVTLEDGTTYTAYPPVNSYSVLEKTSKKDK